MDQNNIEQVYELLKSAKQDYSESYEFALSHRVELEGDELKALCDGTIVGKNADERKAAAAVHFHIQRTVLQDAEYNERQAKLALDLAQLDVDCLKAQLRLMEVLKAEG